MSSKPSAPRKATLDASLVFDGDCAFCTSSAEWVKRRFKHLPYVTPWQEVDLERLGLTARQCHDALQWVDYRGVASGAQAVGRLLQAQGGLWRLIAWPPFVWPFSAMAEGLYNLVAKNRYRLPGGTPACAVPESRDLGEMSADELAPREFRQDHEDGDESDPTRAS